MAWQMNCSIGASFWESSSMSRLIFSAVIFAYIWVERMLVCPISFDSVSMGTPLERHIVVAYECLL